MVEAQFNCLMRTLTLHMYHVYSPLVITWRQSRAHIIKNNENKMEGGCWFREQSKREGTWWGIWISLKVFLHFPHNSNSENITDATFLSCFALAPFIIGLRSSWFSLLNSKYFQFSGLLGRAVRNISCLYMWPCVWPSRKIQCQSYWR